MNRTESITWGPAIDHDLIQGPTSSQLLNGQFVKIPIIAGATDDEGTAFRAPPNITTESDLITAYPSPGIPALSDDNSPAIRLTAAPLPPSPPTPP